MKSLIDFLSKFNSLYDLQKAFPDNESCIKGMEKVLWEGEPVSPYDVDSKVYKCKKGKHKGKYLCSKTKKYFTVISGTILSSTKIKLPIWFQVIYQVLSHKQGIASTTIAREYGISQTAAWFMLQKIRRAMGFENSGELEGVVEVDEYYEGGSFKNMHYDKKLKAKEKTYQNKTLLQGFVEREGRCIIRPIPDITDSTLQAGVYKHVKKGSTLYSDENPSYQKLLPRYEQGSVNHSKGNYVGKKDKRIHTNTVESLWATRSRHFKTHIQISEKYILNYANETSFRYNTRKIKMADAFIWFLLNIANTKITWRELVSAKN